VNSDGTSILVGDSIENLANARVMMAAARMFGTGCAFANFLGDAAAGTDLPRTLPQDLAAGYAQVIACDNLAGARELYGFRVPAPFALVVGNERRGLTHSMRNIATCAVQIPMVSRRINCLNVAAASAVALNYLTRLKVGPSARSADPAARRPEVLLAAASDHIELGSAIRSAAAFGWQRLLVEDRHRVWFGVDRIVRSEGRAAARRARNDIRLLPVAEHKSVEAPERIVVTVGSAGTPLHRLNLARGPRQLVVIPDESAGPLNPSDDDTDGRRLQMATLGLSDRLFPYHYRLIATLVLAEIARQVGSRSVRAGRPRPGPEYFMRLPVEAEAAGETVSLDELRDY
jgi:tRNA G18 (ribose-2'-O)-methylase SpoU